MGHNARYTKLQIEYTKLMNIAANSAFIQIDPVEVQPGWPPEKYIITYTCAGIARIDQAGLLESSNFHQVSLSIGHDYPRAEPYLKWLTPIWHPNIEHEEPYHVCTNNVQTWWSRKSLADLVIIMGEMVQYKRYHAAWRPPYPLDHEAAKWVLDYAEPKGIVGPDNPFDDRPLLRLPRMRPSHVPLPGAENVTATAAQSRRMKLGRRTDISLDASHLAASSRHEESRLKESLHTRQGGTIKLGKTVRRGNP